MLTLEKINTGKLDINSHKNISLTKIGNFIKEARISKNQSLHELASKVKISEQQLKAIEEGREDLLPETIFVKAMIRKISEKLKLEIPDFMTEYKDFNKQIKEEKLGIKGVEKEEEKGEENVLSNVVTKEPKKNRSITLGFIINIFISGIIGFIASSYILSFLFDVNYESDKQTLIKEIK